MTPEERLWIEVMLRGIKDAAKPPPQRSERYRYHADHANWSRARGWLGSRDFETVASLAGLDPEAARDWAKEQIKDS